MVSVGSLVSASKRGQNSTSLVASPSANEKVLL
jgi:hypothetical protein